MKDDSLLLRAKALKLHGVVAHWEEVRETPWIKNLIEREETERSQRGVERRLMQSHMEPFKPLINFDWSWPKKCDRGAVEEFMQLDFLKNENPTNIIFCGPSGVGKSTIASNILYQAVLRGYTGLFTTAGRMLSELASQDGANALRRKIKYYSQPDVLVCDELGFLSYSNRHADLLFEIISRRYQKKSTLVTTNKPFAEWKEIFPNASCVVSLVDRLVHHSEIINIEAESFRFKEAREKALNRKKTNSKKAKMASHNLEKKDEPS